MSEILAESWDVSAENMCGIYIFGQLQQPEGFTQIEMKQRFSFLYKTHQWWMSLIMPSLYLSSCVLSLCSISPQCLNGILPGLPFDASRLIVLVLLCVCVCVVAPGLCRFNPSTLKQEEWQQRYSGWWTLGPFSDTFHSAAHKGTSWGLRYVPSEGDRFLRHGCLVSGFISLLLLDVYNSPADGLVF